MVIDAITYNGERDLFELRYQILKDYVDEFVVVEFNNTFSGLPKSPLFQQFYPKVNYNYKSDYFKYEDLALASPNTEYGQGAKHWIREFCQKESIKDCLTHLKDEDIVFIGDCDEIWERDVLNKFPTKLKLRVYSYYLNNRSNEEFWGTLVAQYKEIKNQCLNHLRTNSPRTLLEYGWHFTSLKDALPRKLTDSYTKETYASDWVMQHLNENIENNRDFLGRNFQYKRDESDWPQYLKDNKDQYQHLCLS